MELKAYDLIISYFKITKRKYIYDEEYKLLSKQVLSKINNTSLKRKFSINFSSDDDIHAIALESYSVLNNGYNHLSLKEDIKSKTIVNKYRVDYDLEKIIRECFQIRRQKFIDPNLNVESHKLYPVLGLKK